MFSFSVISLKFHCNSLQASRTYLSILADLNYAVIWTVSIRPSISNSSRPFSKPLENVPSVQVIIGITVTYIFHNFLSFLASIYLSFRFLWFSLSGSKKRQNPQYSLFSFLKKLLLGQDLLVEIRWSVCTSESWEIYVSHSTGLILVCAYTIWY